MGGLMHMNNTNNLEAIGKRISLTRRSKGMTQENLAEKLGVSPKHISHIECGTSSLSLKSLIEFCKIFDCSMDYIIFGNTESKLLSKLPSEITDILHTGTDADLDRLNRYLQVYVELLPDHK
jgi:transcriptional regulator with XRE-family HTH domain